MGSICALFMTKEEWRRVWEKSLEVQEAQVAGGLGVVVVKVVVVAF